MTKHVHGTIVTQYGVAANNRGENEGNVTTLQKILWKGQTHTTVSAEAIRYALRLYWQRIFEETGDSLYQVNRVWDDQTGTSTFQDQAFSAVRFMDDDVMGYMDAKAAKVENSDGEKTAKGDKPAKGAKELKGTTTARRGPLEVTRAVSVTPFNGEVTFNAKSGIKGNTSLYAAELHATRYQYSFSVTPDALSESRRALGIIDGLSALHNVGGNQGRFLYDFSPALCIFRVTQDPAPRVLYVAESDESGEQLTLHTLLRRIESGDVDALEIYIGGECFAAEERSALEALGVTVLSGIKQTADRVKEALLR